MFFIILYCKNHTVFFFYLWLETLNGRTNENARLWLIVGYAFMRILKNQRQGRLCVFPLYPILLKYFFMVQNTAQLQHLTTKTDGFAS